MRRYSKVEKMLIATGGVSLATYDCKQHGIIQLAVVRENAICPWCKQTLSPVEVDDDLRRQYRKELRLE